MRADTSALPAVRAVSLIVAHRVNFRDAADLQVGQQVRLGFAPEEAICVPER